MKKLLLICLAVVFALPVQAQSLSMFIHGKPRQGELMYAHVTPGASVRLNGEKITPRKDGWFVFGIGRDDKGTLTLTAEKNGERIKRVLKIKPRKWNIQRVDGLPQNTVTPSPEEQERIKKENAAVEKARRKKVRQPLPLCFSRPAHGRISSVYGSQRIINGIPGSPHNALDIANKTGTPIRAPADGIVLLRDDDMLLTGGTVLLGHGQDVTTSYIHMSKIFVKKGQRVKKGDKLGLIGMTGRANGPHLHWTVMWRNKRVDPLVFLTNTKSFCSSPVAPQKKTARKQAKKSSVPAAKKGDKK